MSEKIMLQPVEMTPALMEDLERRNFIIRLGARRHELPSKWGETLDRPVYDSADRWGAHRLLTVTVNRIAFADFATHPDNEDFLLLGDPNTKPLYIVVALMRRAALEKKIADKTLTAADFVCFRVKWNDPEVSFFTMIGDVPHGEAITQQEGRSPSFYVTEGKDLPNDVINFGAYELCVADGK